MIDLSKGGIETMQKRIGSTPFPDGLQGIADDASALISALAEKLVETEVERDAANLERAVNITMINEDAEAMEQAAEKITTLKAERDAARAALVSVNKVADDKEVLAAFIAWTKSHDAKWSLGTITDNGKFSHFTDPDTDTAWLGFLGAWVNRRDAIRAAVTAKDLQPIRARVLPLEWKPSDVDPDSIIAGDYEIYHEGHGYQLYFWSIVQGQPHKTLEAAQKAAFEHHEPRILGFIHEQD